ncbi:hypothetical protein Tco_1407526 [Tanacetum coccineum]
MTQTVPSKSTANVTYQGTARSRVPQAVLSRSTDGSYYPRMDNRRPRISSYSPSSRSSTTRTPHRPYRPKKIVKSIWVKKGSTVGSQAVLPQTVKKSAMIKQTWRPKGNYLDSVNRGNGSYTLKQFEAIQKKISRTMLSLTCISGKYDREQDQFVMIKEFKLAPRKNDVYSLESKESIIPLGESLVGCKGNKMKLSYVTKTRAVNFKISTIGLKAI